jgi:hypothetical protein
MYTSIYAYFVSGNTVSTLVGQHPGGLTLALALGGADPDPNPSPLIPNASNPHQVNIKIKTENHVVWSKDAVDDTGAYTFYVPPDMKAGLYTIEVVGMEPEVECVDSSTFQDAWGFTCSQWSASCVSSRVTACGSNPPVVIVTNAVAAVTAVAAVVASNGTILTPAVVAVNASAAVTTGGNPWAAYVASYPMGGGLGSAGFASTQDGSASAPSTLGHPSPDIYGVQCTVDDLYWGSANMHYWGSGGDLGSGGVTNPTKGNGNAAAIRAACPVACDTCPSNFATPYVGSCQSSTCQTTFTMGANPPPPSSTPPPVQWEVPIIQAFKGSFGLDEIKHGPGPYGTTISSTSTVSGGGTHPGGLNCDYVCHVYEQSNGVVGGRRLLFGGLQSFDSVDTNVFVGCSQDMRDCGCCPGPAPVPYVPP